MKRPLPQFPPILVICCFCMLQIPSSGASPPLATPPDSLNTVDPERLSYFLNQRETRSNQHKTRAVSAGGACDHTTQEWPYSTIEENQDVYKRFLFHYSRTRKPTHPVKPEFAPVHPLMRLAAKLASRRMKRLPQMPRPDSRTATVDFPKKDPTTSFGRPFFLFRPRNGRYTDTKVQ